MFFYNFFDIECNFVINIESYRVNIRNGCFFWTIKNILHFIPESISITRKYLFDSQIFILLVLLLHNTLLEIAIEHFTFLCSKPFMETDFDEISLYQYPSVHCILHNNNSSFC